MTTANGHANGHDRPRLTPEQRGPHPVPYDRTATPSAPPRMPDGLEAIEVRTEQGWRLALFVCEYRADAIVVQFDGEAGIASVWGGYGEHLGAWRFPSQPHARP